MLIVEFGSHIDKNLLLSSSASEDDQHYDRMIDGRTIHLFFQFIEPILNKLYPKFYRDYTDESIGAGRSIRNAFSPRNQVMWRVSYHPTSIVCDLSGVDIAVYSDLNNIEKRTKEIEIGINQLNQIGMGYWIEIALGGVSFPEALNVRDCLELRSYLLDDSDSAEQLLRLASSLFIQYCIEAECSIRNLREADLARYKVLLTEKFSNAVLEEYFRRTNPGKIPSIKHSAKQRQKLFNELSGYTDIPLSCELFGCWYSGWRRSLFIFESPFDTMPGFENLE